MSVDKARANVSALTRTITKGTKANLEELKTFLASHATLWGQGQPVTSKDRQLGNNLVNNLINNTSKPKDALFECFDLYLDYCRAAVENFSGSQRQQAISALQDVFAELDQVYTNSATRPGHETTKQATSVLAPGQNLAYCSAEIEKDVEWLPYFYTTDETPDGKPMDKPLDSRVRDSSEDDGTMTLQRARSNVMALSRTISKNTKANLEELKTFLASHATLWGQGKPVTAKDKALGNKLVRKLCQDSTRPKDAEFECFDLYLDYCRAAVDSFSGAQQQQAIIALQTVFEYLDKEYTNTAPRPSHETTKQATSKLAAGQSLAYCSAQIQKDSNWLPFFYVTDATPDGKVMAKPLDSRVRDGAAARYVQPVKGPPSRPEQSAISSPAERYNISVSRDRHYEQVQQRVATAQEELENDPIGFQNYLMSRAAVHDPRVSNAVFAANSLRGSRAGVPQATADRALASLASSYAGSRLDPYFHSAAGPLGGAHGAWSTGRLSAAEAGARTQAQYHAAGYARVDDPREQSRYGYRGVPMGAHHARYHSIHGTFPHY